MKINSALIIDRPWITKILNGEKDWEMRSTHCSKRGHVGLIEKGTGLVVGIAKLKQSSGPYSQAQMIENMHRHCIPEEMITSGTVDKWNHAWEITHIKKLSPAVPYQHKNGAVTWVTLDAAAQLSIEKQLNTPQTTIETDNTHIAETIIEALVIPPAAVPSAEKTDISSRTIGVSAGNIKNNHIYLKSILDFFPPDTIGGKNKSELASCTVTVDYGAGVTVETDIAGDKKIFRKRTWVKDFFARNQFQPGDRIVINKIAPYCYSVCKEE